MIITKQLLTNKTKFTSGNNPKYIVIHYTAGSGAKASAVSSYFNTSNVISSAHYAVDETSVIECVSPSNIAYHAGDSYYNANSIGIEMCCYCPSGESTTSPYSNWYFANETVENTLELTRYLMETYNIPLENIIRHYDVTKKVCPAPYVNDESKWIEFKSRLKESTLSQIEEALDYCYLSPQGKAGLLGNLFAESGLIPNNLQNTFNTSLGLTDSEYTEKVKSGEYTNFAKDGAGYGLAQWTWHTRKQALYDFTKEYDLLDNAKSQAFFIIKEMEDSFAYVLHILRETDSVEEATEVVMREYLRPYDMSDTALQKRINFAYNYFK